MEKKKDFCRRVTNAVAWLNQNKMDDLRSAVLSMPNRMGVAECEEKKGAMTNF